MELATYLPESFNDMKNISGFGDYKISKYGAGFLGVVKNYMTEHELKSRMHFKKPKKEKKATTTKTAKSDKPTVTATQKATLEMFMDGISIPGIAMQRGLAQTTIETHLAGFVGSGELDIHKLVPRHKLDVILKTIKSSGQTYALKPIKDLLSNEYTYGEIRMALEYYKRIN